MFRIILIIFISITALSASYYLGEIRGAYHAEESIYHTIEDCMDNGTPFRIFGKYKAFRTHQGILLMEE